jgi:hypothetical protein
MFGDLFKIIGGFVVFLVLIFVLNFYGLFSMNFFGPKYRQVENKIFKESEQYNDGMVRDLENLRLQYIGATADQKLALKATIIHRFSVYDENKLTAELRTFYHDLKNEVVTQ